MSESTPDPQAVRAAAERLRRLKAGKELSQDVYGITVGEGMEAIHQACVTLKRKRLDDERLVIDSVIDTPTPNDGLGLAQIVPIRPDPFGTPRSADWPKTRAAFVAFQPACQCCGSRLLLNVHHVLPFHKYPEKELAWDNLITLCEGGRGLNCHLWVGHAGNWSAWNTNVRRDAARFGLLLRKRAGVPWGE